MKNISLSYSSNWIIYLFFAIANILCIGTIQSQAETGKETADRIMLKIKAFKNPPEGYDHIKTKLIEIARKAAYDDENNAAGVKRAVYDEIDKEFIGEASKSEKFIEWLKELTNELLDKAYISSETNNDKALIKQITGTGKTTGQIATAVIANLIDNPIHFTIPASEIPGDGVYQSYVIPTDTTFIIPGNTIMDVPVTGFCTNPNLAPRPSGTEFPPFANWNTSSTLIPTLTKIINVTTELQKSGTYHTPFANQPDIESKVIPQYTFWQYSTPDFNPCIPFKQWHEQFPDQIAIDYGLAQILDAVIITGREAGLPPFIQTDFPPEASLIKDAQPSSNPDIVTTIHVTGTGRTTGHVADIIVSNPTDQTVVVKIGQGNANGINPSYIPASGQYQPYIVSSIPDITLSPNQTNTIQLSGFCTDIHVAPVPPGVEMPSPSQWISLPYDNIISVDPGVVTIPTRTSLSIDESIKVLQSIPSIKWFTEKDCPKYTMSSFPVLPGTDYILTFPVDVEKYPAVGVSLLLDAITKITIEYDRQKEKGIINTPFSGNPEKERESVIQQTLWRYSSSLEGNRYEKNDFQDNTVRQFEKNSGKKFDQQPTAQQQKLVQGVDDFWDTFEAVGTEAKILSRPPDVPTTPTPDNIWNDLPKKPAQSTQPELIGKKGKPVAGPAKNNKKPDGKCVCNGVTFTFEIADAQKPKDSTEYTPIKNTIKTIIIDGKNKSTDTSIKKNIKYVKYKNNNKEDTIRPLVSISKLGTYCSNCTYLDGLSTASGECKATIVILKINQKEIKPDTIGKEIKYSIFLADLDNDKKKTITVEISYKCKGDSKESKCIDSQCSKKYTFQIEKEDSPRR